MQLKIPRPVWHHEDFAICRRTTGRNTSSTHDDPLGKKSVEAHLNFRYQHSNTETFCPLTSNEKRLHNSLKICQLRTGIPSAWLLLFDKVQKPCCQNLIMPVEMKFSQSPFSQHLHRLPMSTCSPAAVALSSMVREENASRLLSPQTPILQQ